MTNKTPTGAYRGFGQPEATLAMERVLDIAAGRLGLHPAELRRRNFVAPEQMPYTVPTGIVLDSGRYAELMDMTLERFGWQSVIFLARYEWTGSAPCNIRYDVISLPRKSSKRRCPISALAMIRPSSFMAISPIGSRAMRSGSSNIMDIRMCAS